MALQLINIGNAPGDGSGDPLRIAFNKMNQNVIELYANMNRLAGIDYGLLGPTVADYGLVTDPLTKIIDHGSI